MALFTHSELRNVGSSALQKRAAKSFYGRITNFSEAINAANSESVADPRLYDIFLCHSKLDEAEILGLRETLQNLGYNVYVDWIDDQMLDRTKVDKATADTLRRRLKQSYTLFYATSENALSSVWMPWELGFFDGFRGKVAITPVADSSNDDSYQGREYCELYPYIVKTGSTLWVHRSASSYVSYTDWKEGKEI